MLRERQDLRILISRLTDMSSVEDPSAPTWIMVMIMVMVMMSVVIAIQTK